MSTVAYMCPCCGAPLAFSAASGKLECASCGNSYETEVIESMNQSDNGGGVKFEKPAGTFDASDAGNVHAYICESCGAELMTDDTTTATECPYCGSPTILPDRISGGVKPEFVVPFVVTKEQVQQQFHDYFKGKKLMPNIFLESRNRISDMRKLYVPYWLYDCEAKADITYDAEDSHTQREGDYEVEYTKHYSVRRRGRLAFDAIPVDGSAKLDNKITESLEPYDIKAAVPFQPAVLAGAMADHADVDADACEKRAVERVETSIAQEMRSTVTGYDHVRERSRSFSSENGKVTPVLMPVWLLTTEKEGKTYTFAINGQTGKLTCDVPADTKKSLLWGGGTFALTFVVIALLMALLGFISGMALIIDAVIAVIAGIVTVSILQGQLNQAVSQDSASGYVRKDSFELDIRHDHYLYTTTRRRKIETDNKKD